ncbi:hypothetical protein Prum_010620 [Phytohabitans rumicis]|uniref:Uncharacterized protein n=1 Tax=Phytohabitans rumicis TaxID=1076125 RepID=A0A6V8KVE1_9ACTN|nr:hypothetical protein Prum_010620 [Phytohabitans rumicis]
MSAYELIYTGAYGQGSYVVVHISLYADTKIRRSRGPGVLLHRGPSDPYVPLVAAYGSSKARGYPDSVSADTLPGTLRAGKARNRSTTSGGRLAFAK